MNKNNVVLDFTQTNSQQEIAIMPAEIAKRALQALAQWSSRVSVQIVLQEHLENLNYHAADNNYKGFIQASAEFVQERQLMDNIQAENWSAYTVTKEEKPEQL